MNRGSQRVFCFLITEASAKALLQAGSRQRKHINTLDEGGRVKILQANMSNYLVIYNVETQIETEERESYPKRTRGRTGEWLKNKNKN